MPVTGPYASGGGDDERREVAGSREALAEAMLRACAELGYERVGIDDVLARGGGRHEEFYRHFTGLDDCYATGYETATERLCTEIFTRAAAAPDWRAGLRAGLGVLAELVSTEPPRARALLLDVHLAGERAEQRRKEISERLARAIDSAREEPEAHHAPPPLTSLFMVSAIEAAAVSALVRDEPASFAEAVPELEQLVVAAYFGD